MKKNKLIANIDFDFSLLAIASQLKEYKLAWFINNQLGVNLIKQRDERFDFLGDHSLCISNYLYQTENSRIRLICNRSRENSPNNIQHLIPELKQFDYLFLIEGFEDTWMIEEVRDLLRNIGGVQMANHIGVDQLKSRENLIF
jgi:hypothetical protein